MCVKTSNWIFYLVMFNLNIRATAVRLYPCASSGYRDVMENSTVTFHCDQYSDGVEWRYRGPQSDSSFPISICNKTHCTASFVPVLTSAFISASNSSLTTTLTPRNVSAAGGEYSCDNYRCRMHIIVPASVSKPTSFITRTDQGFSLHCQTRITKVYSSKGEYSCEWQNGTTRVTGTLDLQPPPGDTNNTSDRMGTCNATLQLSNHADAICNVTVSPGNTVASSVIASVRPSQPEISCPTCPVPENSTVTCTCSTDNFGQPGGRLVWYMETNGVFDREIVRGNFEVNRLIMTWTVTRSDHNVTMFRCVNVNEWAGNVNSLTDFTAIVNGDAPSSSERRRSSNTISSICDEADTPGEDAQSIIIIAISIGWGATVVCVVVIFVVIKRQRKGAAKERPRAQSIKPSVQHNAVRSDVSIIARTTGESSDNPSFGAYESLQSADVGQTSVYSEMTHGSGPVYGNSAIPKQ